MAIVSTLSNHYKYQKSIKNITFSTDVFKIILMNTGFVFDKDTHATLADVTSSQIATNYGYVQNDKVLVFTSIMENDSTDSCEILFEILTWVASGGSIGPIGAACIYDDTTSDDTIIGCIDFGEDITITDTQVLRVNIITLRET